MTSCYTERGDDLVGKARGKLKLALLLKPCFNKVSMAELIIRFPTTEDNMLAVKSFSNSFEFFNHLFPIKRGEILVVLSCVVGYVVVLMPMAEERGARRQCGVPGA